MESLTAIDGVRKLASGPIDVEVALAWRLAPDSETPHIDSFVNLGRTCEDGRHVDGLVDGISGFFGSDRRASVHGLVAAVSVVLADVKYGNPTKDRLDSPEARAPVADATRKALAAWAERYPAAAAERRERMSGLRTP
jgi:DNA gyrase/topoisomerase IV subunit B